MNWYTDDRYRSKTSYVLCHFMLHNRFCFYTCHIVYRPISPVTIRMIVCHNHTIFQETQTKVKIYYMEGIVHNAGIHHHMVA